MATFSKQNTGINPYAVGDKIYGGGRSFPTMGPVDKMGYRERDAKASARRSAILRRLQAKQSGKYASADALREV